MLRVTDFIFFKNFCNIYYIKKSNVRLNSNSSTSNCNFNFLETMILFKEYTNLEKFETFFTADTYNENKQKFLQFLLYLQLTRLLYNFINPLNLNDIEVYRTSFQSLEFPRIFNVLTLKNCNSNVIYMLFLYYRSLQIRMGGKKGKAWIDEDGFVSRNSGM